jgi:hypothetical protein
MKSGEAPQQRGFAAAAGPKQKKQLPGCDGEIELPQRHNVAEAFGELLDQDRDHRRDANAGTQPAPPGKVKKIRPE